MKSKSAGLERTFLEVTEQNDETSKKPNESNLEILEKAKQRQFPPEYKLRILEEADRCRKSGEVSPLLRREGLYSSLHRPLQVDLIYDLNFAPMC